MENAAPHNEKELLLQIAEGNEQAFEELFNKYSDLLYSYTLKIVHNEFWAEEIVQVLFMQLWENRGSLVNVNNLAPYLFRIAANRSVDWLRKNEAEARMQYYIVSKDNKIHNEVEEQFDYRTSEELVREAINTLPEQRKRIYLLKTEENNSYEQIADQLQVSKHTVRNQMAKALQTIRKYLLEKGIMLIFLP